VAEQFVAITFHIWNQNHEPETNRNRPIWPRVSCFV